MTYKAWRLALAGLAMLGTSPAFAVTGGIPVEDVLSGQGKSAERVHLASQIADFTVSIAIKDGNDYASCSGTLVHPRVVLTAAHCVLGAGGAAKHITVFFGLRTLAGERRQMLDSIAHPEFTRAIGTPSKWRGSAGRRGLQMPVTAIHADVALVLLHRPMPAQRRVVAPVPAGFRDARTTRKFVAGFGTEGRGTAAGPRPLQFGEMFGNSSSSQVRNLQSGEIVMETHYKGGSRVNTCPGDSGGPILVLDGQGRLRQFGVTVAGDLGCREVQISASLDSERATLRRMFDELMQGEQGAAQNPF